MLWQLVKVTSEITGLLNSNETDELLSREPDAEPPHDIDSALAACHKYSRDEASHIKCFYQHEGRMVELANFSFCLHESVFRLSEPRNAGNILMSSGHGPMTLKFICVITSFKVRHFNL